MLGLDPLAFELGFEGFWNLYCLHHCIEISPKKMQTLVTTKIKLVPNEMLGTPELPGLPVEDGQEETEANQPTPGQPAYDPISAVVRVRIAKKIPEPYEEDGEMITPEYNEDELEEMEIGDKCLSVTTNNGEQSILCINQAAARVVR